METTPAVSAFCTHKIEGNTQRTAKAAEQGNTVAQRSLGPMFFDFEVVPKDEKKGVEWMTMATEQGGALAQRIVGSRYLQGDGVPMDATKGIKWLTKAAVQGDAEAQQELRRLEMSTSLDGGSGQQQGGQIKKMEDGSNGLCNKVVSAFVRHGKPMQD